MTRSAARAETHSPVRGGGLRPASNGEANRLLTEDRAAHEWFRFVLSYPPHLVREYLQRFGMGSGDTVLDPFCGTGTTVVECKKMGVASVGIEANPMAHFATRVKLDWQVDPDDLLRHATRVAEAARERLGAEGIPEEGSPLFARPWSAGSHMPLRGLPAEQMKLVVTQ